MKNSLKKMNLFKNYKLLKMENKNKQISKNYISILVKLRESSEIDNGMLQNQFKKSLQFSMKIIVIKIL